MKTKTFSPWRMATNSGNRFHVVRDTPEGIEFRASAVGKTSNFMTREAANRVARRLNEDAVIEAELRAKYAGLPPMPDARGALSRAVRGT